MVKLGYQVLNWGPLANAAFALQTAQRAEALGYDSLVVTDHVVIPRHVESRYPYTASGQLGVPVISVSDADGANETIIIGFDKGGLKKALGL